MYIRLSEAYLRGLQFSRDRLRHRSSGKYVTPKKGSAIESRDLKGRRGLLVFVRL
jgi:hypothetical protein